MRIQLFLYLLVSLLTANFLPVSAGANSATATNVAIETGHLTVTVQDQKGQPLKQAVVSLMPLSGQNVEGYQKNHTEMEQKNRLFNPFILVVQKNTKVSFPNRDNFRHHVYSFSKAKSFELRLYGKDEQKSVEFDQVGVVPLGCNIHDNMLAFIYVTEAPVFKKADEKGKVSFKSLPVGDYKMTVWHVDQKKKQSQAEQTVKVLADGSVQSVQLSVRSRKFIQKAADKNRQY